MSHERRTETRKERYNKKVNSSFKYPVEIACVNFKHEPNIGYVIRAAACFGSPVVNIIGDCPSDKVLKMLSGTTSDFIKLQKFSNPHMFLEYCRTNDIKVVSAELTENSRSLYDYTFPKNNKICIVVGNEQTGIPADILQHSDIVQIPMPGVGYCLNTAMSANIMLFEYTKQQAMT